MRQLLGETFSMTARDVTPETVDITTAKLFDILKPVLDASKEYLTNEEIDSMKSLILKSDDSLSAFAREHAIRAPEPSLPNDYEHPYYSQYLRTRHS